MIVTLSKDLRILDLFLQSVEDKSKVIVGVDNNAVMSNIDKQYDCQLIGIDEIYNDPFLSKFTTFKKCILINYLLEQGKRNFLFCDDDCAILKPVSMEQTRLKPVNYIDYSSNRVAQIIGCTKHHHEAGCFVLNLSDHEANLYITMFWDFVAAMKEHEYLFFSQKDDNFMKERERGFNMFFCDTMFLNKYFGEIQKIEDENLAINLHDIHKHSLEDFELYLKINKLYCNIFHFNASKFKIQFMEFFYKSIIL